MGAGRCLAARAPHPLSACAGRSRLVSRGKRRRVLPLRSAGRRRLQAQQRLRTAKLARRASGTAWSACRAPDARQRTRVVRSALRPGSRPGSSRTARHRRNRSHARTMASPAQVPPPTTAPTGFSSAPPPSTWVEATLGKPPGFRKRFIGEPRSQGQRRNPLPSCTRNMI
jgi:hypothetical protein